MKRTIGIWLAGCATILFAACGGGNSLGLMDRHGNVAEDMMDLSAPMEASYAAGEAGADENVQEQVDVSGKKIIRDGQMGIRVGDLGAAKTQVDSLVGRLNAYYASESFNESSYETSYRLKIRIPSPHFDRFIAELESGGGKVLYKELFTRDVTEQFTDIELRLANKRNYLKRYQELVAQAKSVKDMLDIEEKIRGLEEEIESTEGRLRLLNNQIAYSTLSLTISIPVEYKFTPGPQRKFFERIKKAVTGGWRGIVSFVVMLFYIWPLILVTGAILYVLLRNARKRKRRSHGNIPPTPK